MVARKLSSYLKKKNKFNQEIGEWAENLGNSKAKCVVCEKAGEGSVVTFTKGDGPLIAHSETDKHQRNLKKVIISIRGRRLFVKHLGLIRKRNIFKMQQPGLKSIS